MYEIDFETFQKLDLIAPNTLRYSSIMDPASHLLDLSVETEVLTPLQFGSAFIDVTASEDPTNNLGAGNDVFIGTAADEIVNGEGGNDLIRGEGGNDTLSGGDGVDTLYGGAGADILVGGIGDDYLHIDAADTLSGGAGYDTAIAEDISGSGLTIDLGGTAIERVFATHSVDYLDASSLTGFGASLYGYAGRIR